VSRDLIAALGGHKPTIFIGAHGGLSARLGEQAGFDAIWASGFEIASAIGLPDASVISPSEIVRASANIASSISIPILVDMDSGYGDHTQVYFYTKDFVRAGVQGICIEDKRYPKHNSFVQREQRLESIEGMVQKLRAAQIARDGKRFCIVARTEAFVAGAGLQEALERADAYARCGADAIVVQSRRSDAEEVSAFMQQWTAQVPVIVIPTSYPSVTVDELAAMGIRGVIFANQGLRAAVCAIRQTYKAILSSGSSAAVESQLATMKEMFSLQGYDELDTLDGLIGVKLALAAK